eukprot:3643397-Karenia_brevis.AAC.1
MALQGNGGSGPDWKFLNPWETCHSMGKFVVPDHAHVLAHVSKGLCSESRVMRVQHTMHAWKKDPHP